jgi:hypothetical protein
MLLSKLRGKVRWTWCMQRFFSSANCDTFLHRAQCADLCDQKKQNQTRFCSTLGNPSLPEVPVQVL